ncbi:DNA alkylation repair protein [Neobacillus mesonae]|uniref:DNA alkylation repair protein n=1 Tax=Neobacillus mesonae TaxID=1193713 RepID=UPI002040B08B|nr:DNA alkylation repair protein [Neobacillus mesonae]MCM3567117.1 DNA alkylation repair protein [Neobacillus mesonae]
MQSNITILTRLFQERQNPVNADQMEKYMKNHFPFFGIKSPERKEIEKQFFQETEILKEPFNQDFILELWEQAEREYQYTALAYIEKSLKRLGKKDLALMETLITKKSWWDTVDPLASKPVGKIAQVYPEAASETIDAWAEHDDMWLRRTAILFQLKYKQKTNEEKLFQYIRLNAGSKEFFIQKAIGWALREYSKTNPMSVKAFIEGNTLARLSVREGSKY